MKKFIGQQMSFNMFENGMNSDKLAHAYLLCADEGMGKKSLANVVAAAILCENPINGRPCNRCKSCKMIEMKTHPDLNIVVPKSKNKKLKIEEVREALSNLYVKPSIASKKIIIINDNNDFNIASQNCILKSLEEPPPYAIFFITTHNVNSIIDTIKSRSVIINFAPYTNEEMITILTQNRVENDDIFRISSISRNNPGKALKLVKDAHFIKTRDELLNNLTGFHRNMKRYKNILDLFEMNKQNYLDLLDIIETLFRDLVLYSSTFSEDLLINYDKKGMILEMVSKKSTQAFINCVDICEETRYTLERQGNYLLTIDAMLLKMQEELSA